LSNWDCLIKLLIDFGIIYCVAAVINGSVVSAMCVSAVPAHILNNAFDFKVS